jgi:hypothetical protein
MTVIPLFVKERFFPDERSGKKTRPRSGKVKEEKSPPLRLLRKMAPEAEKCCSFFATPCLTKQILHIYSG